MRRRLALAVAAMVVVTAASLGTALLILRAEAARSFLGAWQSAEGETIVFDHHGTVVLASGKTTWSAKPGTLRIGHDRYRWRVRDAGKTLVLTPIPFRDDAPPVVYHR